MFRRRRIRYQIRSDDLTPILWALRKDYFFSGRLS
jgi:hypothetical protein